VALAWQVGAQPATVVADEEPQLGGSDRGGDLDGTRKSRIRVPDGVGHGLCDHHADRVELLVARAGCGGERGHGMPPKRHRPHDRR
jgi:hypothetical protein